MFELVFIGIILFLLIACLVLGKLFLGLRGSYDELLFSKQSQSVKYGQLTEQWLPFSKNFPFSSQNFRFIGKPVDGICFEDDRIVFVEFKSNKSVLNEHQRKVRDLVEGKKVEWFELRAD